jgi:hypothetical protein
LTRLSFLKRMYFSSKEAKIPSLRRSVDVGLWASALTQHTPAGMFNTLRS